ncbi:unnamed protein product [Paramecium pentaurelia]|uniref:Uncharacterized protein n=1 Tax=Paramecium pentaurelia TaxID=43138 RepID=A0A8S1XZS2_9CILI|nr:unnamed protein product [Paramecium pentaurelia]
MKIRQPLYHPVVQQFQCPTQYVSFASPTQRFSQGQRLASPTSQQIDYQRLRNAQSIQQSAYANKISQDIPQHMITKKPHIKMPQQGVQLSQSQSFSYNPQMMVGLIKENQEIKAKIIEKEKQLILLQQEIDLYEKKS